MSDHDHHHHSANQSKKGGMPWWLWVALVIILGVVIWYNFGRDRAEATGFVIEPGRGIVHYTSYQDGINRAEACGIPLTMGRGESAVPISYAAARALEADTDRVQVTALVYVGDTFGPNIDDCPARASR